MSSSMVMCRRLQSTILLMTNISAPLPIDIYCGKIFLRNNAYSNRMNFNISVGHFWLESTRRYLASSRRHIREPQQPKALANERLVSAVVKKSSGMSPDDIRVRLIVDKQKDEEEGLSISGGVVSLTKAIKASVELDQDLIGLDLQQEIPVVKVDNLKKLAYQQSRKSQQSSKKGQTPSEKEFRFKTGIGDNDLQRKIDDMSTFLEKGHNCIVSIRSTRRTMLKDPDIATNTANKVLEIASDVGELEGELKIAPSKSFARFRIKPLKNRKKKDD